MSKVHNGIMRFEVKTDQQLLLDKLPLVLNYVSIFFFLIVIISISLSLGKISRYSEINYLCNLFTVEKSGFNFKRLSKLTSQTSKQKMWDLCKQITKSN